LPWTKLLVILNSTSIHVNEKERCLKCSRWRHKNCSVYTVKCADCWRQAAGEKNLRKRQQRRQFNCCFIWSWFPTFADRIYFS
jgi:hypothetical protein